MNNKKIAERLNQELDAMGVPCLMTERVQACSKLFNIPRFKVEAILKGSFGDFHHMQKIADELELDIEQLMGKAKNDTHH